MIKHLRINSRQNINHFYSFTLLLIFQVLRIMNLYRQHNRCQMPFSVFDWLYIPLTNSLVARPDLQKRPHLRLALPVRCIKLAVKKKKKKELGCQRGGAFFQNPSRSREMFAIIPTNVSWRPKKRSRESWKCAAGEIYRSFQFIALSGFMVSLPA